MNVNRNVNIISPIPQVFAAALIHWV